jgi:hypothetical protein
MLITKAMETEYNAMGKPGIWRNDKFWIAGDHVVDPRIKENPKIKALVESSERARDQFKMTEYQGMNGRNSDYRWKFWRRRLTLRSLVIRVI